MGTRHREIDTCNIEHKTQTDRHVTLDTGNRKRDTSNIGHKTQNDRHGKHWAKDKER